VFVQWITETLLTLISGLEKNVFAKLLYSIHFTKEKHWL